MAFQAKLLSHMFFKVIQYGYETFQNVAPILHSVICKIEEDNKFKILSCQVRNNMEATLHVKDCKFHKPGK